MTRSASMFFHEWFTKGSVRVSPEAASSPHESQPQNASNLSKCQLDFRVASRHFFSKGRVRAQTRPEDARSLAPQSLRWHKRARRARDTHRLARGDRVSVPRARVSRVARDARTARAVRRARYIAGVGQHIKSAFHLSNPEATRSGRRTGRVARGRGSVTGSRPDLCLAPCG